jgi:hypothetical protein
MTWAQDWRQDYIRGHLRTAGSIRGRDLMAAFAVSRAQASADLSLYRAKHPGELRYDSSRKAYVKTN